MLKIKLILFLFVGLGFAGCQTAKIPEPYNFKVKELQKNPFGCWMEINSDSMSVLSTAKVSYSGELLTITSDSVFLLVSDGEVQKVKKMSVLSANLYTHKNQSGTYLLLTALYAVPAFIGAAVNPDYAGEFFVMVIPVTLVGVFQSVKDGISKKNILIYPQKNSFEEFIPFARFPSGMPKNIDFEALDLKK
jgi:hypothetical protein